MAFANIVMAKTTVGQGSTSFAYPISSERAKKKIAKIMEKQGCSYQEAREIRFKRVGF